MRQIGGWVALMALAAGAALADAPRRSIRPEPRPLPVTAPAPVLVYYRATIRPRPRADSAFFAPEQAAAPPVTEGTGGAGGYVLATTPPVYRSPRPPGWPVGLRRGAAAGPADSGRTQAPQRVASVRPTAISVKGALCGDPRIRGEVLAPIAGTRPGCGVKAPVRVHSIDGVKLSQPSVMNCQTANTLAGWITGALKPALGRRGGGVASLSVPSHYACRTRNSQPGAKISEHGKGRAIDISAINFNNGTRLTIRDGWKNRFDKRLLERLHKAACGPFGTVLGPDANRFHAGHFHFDTAVYRGGAYCR